MGTQVIDHDFHVNDTPARARTASRMPLPANSESRVASSESPRFIVTLAASTTESGLIRIPLAISGKWVRGATMFAISREDLESIVRNFGARQNGEINVDYDHASEMPEVAAGGPVPSAGRIVRLDAPEVRARHGVPLQNEPFILYGWFEPTARARQLLANREYRFISPAIEWGAKNKRTGQSQGTTLTSVALTNRPFLEEMPQIRLSDPAFVPLNESGKGAPAGRPKSGEASVSRRTHPYESGGEPPHSQGGSMKHVNLSVEDGRIHITHEDLPGGFYFEAADLAAVGARHGVPLQEGSASAVFSESAVVTFAQARTLLSEAEARGKFIPAAEVFHAAAEQELDEAVRAGKVLPRQRDDWRKIALSDLPTFRKLMGAQKPVVPLAPVGLAGTPPSDVQGQIKFLAEQRMRERQVTYGQALADIGREQPDLMQQYRRAVSSE